MNDSVVIRLMWAEILELKNELAKHDKEALNAIIERFEK